MSSNVLEFNRSRFQNSGHFRNNPKNVPFLLDVRSPEEFESGHLWIKSAPGGQLVQATDEYVGVRNSRLVLIDDTGVRAIMTASWLIQMGWEEVYVLEGGLENNDLETGPEQKKVLGLRK